MSVYFYSVGVDFQIKEKSKYRNWLIKVSKFEKKEIELLEINFVSENEIIRINKEYLHHNWPTDIITFDSTYLNMLRAEIFICIEVVKRNSKEYSQNNFRKELDRVIIHGLLHLLGYSDNTTQEIAVMREKENYYIPYLELI
ncbi:MAG: rRNA maturation RNase YbeY [Bacteroidales bacterium]|nr:rRNA maturation RNase YbeY [Bacteroidales bacterium]